MARWHKKSHGTEQHHDSADVELTDVRDDEIEPKIPWHFWIAVSLCGLYLAFRFVQVTILAIHAIF